MKKLFNLNKFISYRYTISYALTLLLSGALLIASTKARQIKALGSWLENLDIDIICILVGLILLFSCIKDKPWDKRNRTLMRLVCVIFYCLFFDACSFIFDDIAQFAILNRIVTTMSYLMDDVIVFCFWKYIQEELELKGTKSNHTNIVCAVLAIIGNLMALLNIKLGYYFVITDEGEFIKGGLERFSDTTAVIILIIVFVTIIKQKNASLNDKFILISFTIFPFLSTVYTIYNDSLALIYPCYMLSVVFIYNNIYLQKSKRIAEQEATLAKQSTALMISQIQPHFLYNTLTTISNLCVKDPEEAEETTIKFSKYLRSNLDSLRQMDPVPFSKELDHIKTYVELEKKRFGDKLNVEYVIEDTNFLVPSIGIQPLVENAIKHGICKKREPGHLILSCKLVENGHEIIIEDDGIGFDPNGPMPEDGRSHVGMLNVKNRLKQMCNAKMEVISSPGNGCRVIVHFSS